MPASGTPGCHGLLLPPSAALVGGGGAWYQSTPQRFFGDMLAWFRVMYEEGGPLFSELRSGRGLHTYTGILVSQADSYLGMDRLAIHMVGRY